MQDASVVLIAFAFTGMVLSSTLPLPLKARLAIFAAGAALVLVSLTVPVRLPVSRAFGDALDILALLVLASAATWALSARGKPRRKQEERGGG